MNLILEKIRKWRVSLKNRPGETLVEILVGLFALSLGSVAATGLIIMALQSNGRTKSELIALNLAREGVEAVQNIRDTNWLRWSGDPESCWDLRDDSHCFTAPNRIVTGLYRVGIDQGYALTDSVSFSWSLEPAPSAAVLNLNDNVASNDFFRLDIIDRFENFDSDGDGIDTNDADLYTHTTGTNTTPFAGGPLQNGALYEPEESPFYRMIYIEHATPSDPIEVHSVVQWMQGGQLRQVDLSTTLTNHFKKN